MRGYVVNGPSEAGTANKTAVTIIASTSVRPRIYEFEVALSTAPNSTDQQLAWAVGRTTTTGTAASNPTPNPVDPADVASVATAGITHSAEPTYASTYLLSNAQNQRAMFRFVAVPGYEFVVPASANNCFGAKIVSITASSTLLATVMFME